MSAKCNHEKCVYIRSKLHPYFVLEVDGFLVQLKYFNGTLGQMWRPKCTTFGRYFFVNHLFGHVLSLHPRSDIGGELTTWMNIMGLHQQWSVNSDGTIVNGYKNNLAIEVPNGMYAHGATLRVYERRGTQNQQFILTPMSQEFHPEVFTSAVSHGVPPDPFGAFHGAPFLPGIPPNQFGTFNSGVFPPSGIPLSDSNRSNSGPLDGPSTSGTQSGRPSSVTFDGAFSHGRPLSRSNSGPVNDGRLNRFNSDRFGGQFSYGRAPVPSSSAPSDGTSSQERPLTRSNSTPLNDGRPNTFNSDRFRGTFNYGRPPSKS